MQEIKKLLEVGAHFGHRTSRWSPKMKPYIWGAKNKIHLIDVSKTVFLLNRATNFIKEVSANGGSVLWVGTKKSANGTIKNTAQKLNMPFVIHRWIGGTLSNFDQIKKAMTRYLHLQDIVAKASPHYSKKELSAIQKEILRLEKNIGGILNLNYPPACVVAIDAKKEHAAIREARSLGIPVIAMVDTNTDPSNINFVIPANDDAPRAIGYIVDQLAQAVEDGKKLFVEREAAAAAEAKAKKAQAKEAASKKKDAEAVTAENEIVVEVALESSRKIDAAEEELEEAPRSAIKMTEKMSSKSKAAPAKRPAKRSSN